MTSVHKKLRQITTYDRKALYVPVLLRRAGEKLETMIYHHGKSKGTYSLEVFDTLLRFEAVQLMA